MSLLVQEVLFFLNSIFQCLNIYKGLLLYMFVVEVEIKFVARYELPAYECSIYVFMYAILMKYMKMICRLEYSRKII